MPKADNILLKKVTVLHGTNRRLTKRQMSELGLKYDFGTSVEVVQTKWNNI